MSGDAHEFWALLANPWHLAVPAVLITSLELVRWTMPDFFANGGRGNRLLRPACVLGGLVAYLLPGAPWAETEVPVVVNAVVGFLIGALATWGYALFADMFATFKGKSAKTVGDWIEVVKKGGLALIALLIAGSGVYGAWLKPETGAKKAYDVTSEAIATLSKDVQLLNTSMNEAREARHALDKNTAIDMALVKQRLTSIEDALVRRLAYRPPREGVRVDESVATAPTGEPKIVEDSIVTETGDKGPKIRRLGLEIQMPAAREVF